MVYVLNKQGEPIMPSTRHGWVRRALKEGKAKVVNRTPFVIQLTYEPGTNVLQVTHLGGDSGYKHVGVSVVCQESGRELFAAQVDLLEGVSERLRDRAMYRRARRSRGGTTGQRCAIHSVEQKRRNNRSLRKFYDAKYVDKRNGSIKTGKELSSSRKTRSRENLGENLRQHRAHKLKSGCWSTRTKRADFQPGDLIRYKGQVITIKGSKSYGRYVVGGGYDNIPTKAIQRISYGKGFVFNLTQGGAIPPTTSASGKLGYPGVR